MPAESSEKEYAVSLGSSFYSNTNSLAGEYALEIKAVYRSCKLNAEYDFGNNKAGFLIENSILNSALGVNASLAMIKEASASPAWVFNISWKL